MKKVIFGIIIGIAISGVVFAMSASDIEYKNNKNVGDALDDLYTKVATFASDNVNYDLLWENTDIHVAFEPTNISLDLSDYTSVIVMGKYHLSSSYDNNIEYKKINVGSSGVLTIRYSQNDSATRNIIVRNDGIEIEQGHKWDNSESSGSAIPMFIIGVK